jgi:hypothetical protein
MTGSLVAGCTKEVYDDTSFAQNASAPAALTALFNITQDNTGLVTITPNGEGAVTYDVFFGDGTATPVQVAAGKSTQHNFKEGVYDVKFTGHSINGKTTEGTQKLTVSFKAPENLQVTAGIDAANNYKVNVTATADFETVFKVYYGDVANEVPVSFNEGQTVSHTYTAVGDYTLKVVALSGGAATTELTKVISIVDPVLLPVNFESPTINYAFNNFDGGNATVIANPKAGGINTSTKVGKMVKNAGQTWGGSWIGLGSAIDFSAGKYFRMKVYSPRVGAKVLLKVENASNSAVNFEKEVSTTKANEWEDLVFDYSAINKAEAYHHIVLIFDNGTAGDGSANFTWYFDDIRLTNTLPVTLLTLPVTFDDANTVYNPIDFGNNQTIAAKDPLNASNNVMKTTKLNGAETWAGTTVGTFATKIPVTASASNMSLKVYSPAAGIHVRLKLEDHKDNTHTVETEAITKVANGWETLVFDFNNQAAGTATLNPAYNFDMASVFFDFNVAGNGKIFYWDDLIFVGSSAPVDALALPLTFQSTTLDYSFTNFDGGSVTIVDNGVSGGINTSTKVGKMVKNAGQPWGGSYIALSSPINFSAGKTFRMKVYSPKVGTKVLLKVENLTDGGISYEKEVATTKAGEWEDLSFDYSGIDASKSYQKVVLIFELGTPGDGSANFTYFFDDIRLQ